MSRPSVAEKRKTFRKLHEGGCFVIPNPWNVGSARYLQGLGFKALATTSSGHAHSVGYADGAQSLDNVHCAFPRTGGGHRRAAQRRFRERLRQRFDSLAANVTRCVATGVSGLSIEDSPNNSATPLYDLDTAVARVKAARAAIDRAGGDVVFTGARRRLYPRRARSR